MRDAEPVDVAFVALALEPRKVLLPRLQVVDLLDLDAAEPLDLPRVLLASLGHTPGPDLRRDLNLVAARLERRADRGLGLAVHRRRVEEAIARRHRGADNLASGLHVTAEGVPGTEPDDRPEPPFFHQTARPAANAAAKKSGSSPGPRPMCARGSPAQASSQPSTSTTFTSMPSGGSKPRGHATVTPSASRRMSRTWCETPRCRSRGSPCDARA